MNFVAIDFETANYAPDSACAIGLVKVAGGEIVDKAVHLIRPPTREFVFTYIHGLKWKDVAGVRRFRDALAEAGADARRRRLPARRITPRSTRASCARLARPMAWSAPTLPFRCTVQLARKTWNIRPTKLSDVCRELGIALNHHEALSDALACAKS